jgi:hypothetical protein
MAAATVCAPIPVSRDTPADVDDRVRPGYNLTSEAPLCTRLFMCGCAPAQICSGIPATAVLCPPPEQIALAAAWQGVWHVHAVAGAVAVHAADASAEPDGWAYSKLTVRGRRYVFSDARAGVTSIDGDEDSFSGVLKFFRDGARLFFDRWGSYVTAGDASGGTCVLTTALGPRVVCTRGVGPVEGRTLAAVQPTIPMAPTAQSGRGVGAGPASASASTSRRVALLSELEGLAALHASGALSDRDFAAAATARLRTTQPTA